MGSDTHLTLIRGGVDVDEVRELAREAAEALSRLADAVSLDDDLYEPARRVAALLRVDQFADELETRRHDDG